MNDYELFVCNQFLSDFDSKVSFLTTLQQIFDDEFNGSICSIFDDIDTTDLVHHMKDMLHSLQDNFKWKGYL